MDQFPVCQVCRLNHLTENHECYICHEKGADSHHFLTCPNRCKFCGSSHTISEHECFVCHHKGSDSHDFLNCPKKCRICYSFHLTEDHQCSICHLKGENSHHFMKCPEANLSRMNEKATRLSSIGRPLFGMFSRENLQEKDKKFSPPTSGTCISKNSLATGPSPEGRIELDNSSELEPITSIKGMFKVLKERLGEESQTEIVYADTNSVMFRVSSTEDIEKVNECLKIYNHNLKLMKGQSFQVGVSSKKVYQS